MRSITLYGGFMKFSALIAFLFLTLFATLVHAATYTNVDYPRAALTSANGINNSGVIVGEYVASGVHGFTLNDGVYSTVDFPIAFSSTWCEGINDNGDIVGFYESPSDTITHSF